jgi:hypothetical protein
MKPPKAGRSLRRRRFHLFLLLTLGAAFWIFRPITTLSDRATRLLSGVNRYFWRAPSDIYIGERAGDGRLRRFEISGGSLRERGIVPDPAGKNTPAYTVSPDGKSIGVVAATRDEWPELCFIVDNIDGTRIFGNSTYPFLHPSTVSRDGIVWLPDSRRWVSLIGGDNDPAEIQLHSLDTPEAGGRAIDTLGTPQAGLPPPKPIRMLLGVTADHRLIATDFNPSFIPPATAIVIPPATTVTIKEIGIYPNPLTAREHTVKSPPGTDVRELALSPKGDRLALIAYSSHVPLITRLLGRILPSVRKNSRPRAGLSVYVGDFDGSHMRELGYQPVDKLGSPHDLKWSPDGRSLSFILGDGLYLIPAD